MISKVPEMIAYLSKFYDIPGGDLILSGTPVFVVLFDGGKNRV